LPLNFPINFDIRHVAVTGLSYVTQRQRRYPRRYFTGMYGEDHCFALFSFEFRSHML
jgi:hypothetical protein